MLLDREARFIESLVGRLTKLHEKTLELANQIPLKTYQTTDILGRETSSTVLSPDVQQNIRTLATSEEFEKWSETVSAFLSRQPGSVDHDFENLVNTFSTYVLLQRSGGPGISQTAWREAFVRESTIYVLALVKLIRDNKAAFSILKPRVSHKYTDFTLKFHKYGEKYQVEADCAVGESKQGFQLPFSDTDLENFILKHCRPRYATVRGWAPTTVRPLTEFGQRLFETVISGEIRDLFYRLRQDAINHEQGIRIRLKLRNTPELADVPWEFLYDGKDFLALSTGSPVTRYFDSSTPVRPLMVTSQLRILVTASSPTDLGTLDVKKELKQLDAAVAPLTSIGVLSVDFAPDGTLQTTQRMLRAAEASNRPYHIWHYIGHGGFDETEKSSVLYFENEKKLAAPISGFELGTLFNSYSALRMVVLNACEGARSSKDDALSGVAVGLVERGLPVVIAMQFEITDKAAIIFAEELYASLLDGLPVDVALTEARRAVLFSPNQVEWVTPVLFMKVESGAIFDINTNIENAIVNS